MKMTLLELLVKELPKRGGWPANIKTIEQASDGMLMDADDETLTSEDPYLFDDFMFIKADDWREGKVTIEQCESALAASKTKWDGDGLPPVGCECEVKIGGDYFNLCRVVYSDDSCGVAFVYLGGDDEKYCGQIDCVSAKAAIDYFRPIRSEADKKRDASIEALVEVYRNALGDVTGAFGCVYDAIASGKITGVKLGD